MSINLTELQEHVRQHQKVARVTIVETFGSAPREGGASMNIWDSGQSGTIGGGALEYQAAENARKLLVSGNKSANLERVPLGPNLGQCCGGAVQLLTQIFDGESNLKPLEEKGIFLFPLSSDSTDTTPAIELITSTDSGIVVANGWVAEKLVQAVRSIWIYGAGHVGRAIVDTLAPLPELGVVWLDVNRDRFPKHIPENTDMLVALDMPKAVAHAPDNAEHLILTFSHAIDLELCSTIISRKFKSVGLIGSTTKWARFRKRLLESGHNSTNIDKITCPIGNVEFGKHPHAIAIGVASQLLLTG